MVAQYRIQQLTIIQGEGEASVLQYGEFDGYTDTAVVYRMGVSLTKQMADAARRPSLQAMAGAMGGLLPAQAAPKACAATEVWHMLVQPHAPMARRRRLFILLMQFAQKAYIHGNASSCD